MKKRIIFVLTAAMLFFSQVMLSSCGDEEEDEPVSNNSEKNNNGTNNGTNNNGTNNNGTNNNQQTVKEESQYTVSYSSDFGVAPQSLTVKEGDKLTSGDLKPLDTDGYIFLGWYNGSSQVAEGFEVKQDLKLVAKWTKDGVLYANELKEFLAKKTDESKVYDITISDLNPDMDAVVKALKDNSKIKVNLNLEGCTELKKVKISFCSLDEPTPIPPTTDPNPSDSPTTFHTDFEQEDAYTHQTGGTGSGSEGSGENSGSGNGGRSNDEFINNLLTLILPNGVTNIVLACDGLTSLNIPNSVKEIYIYMENPPVIRNGNTINVNCTIYVPASAVEIYKNADGWSKYAEQITTEQMNADTEITGTTGSGTDDGETRKQDATYGSGSTFDF